jgi:outer membrane protein
MQNKLIPFLLLAMPLLAQAEGVAPPRDIGVVVTVKQSPFVQGDTEIGGKPVILDRSGFDIPGLSWSFKKAPAHELYVGASLDDWDHQRGDSAELSDMHELDRAINLRVGAAWKLPAGVVMADLAQDMAAHKGTQAKLRYTLNPAPHQARMRPYAEVQWLSADVTDYYVGVDADEAKAGRPAYQADATFALKAGVNLEQPLSPALTLVGGVDVTAYGSEVRDSPIIERSTLWGGQVGLAYRW